MSVVDEALERLIIVGLIVPLLLLWIVAYVDLARRPDFGIRRKALWAVVMFLGAYVGIAAYFILRPVPPPAGKSATGTTTRASEIVTEMEALREGHTDGAMTDGDYLKRKRNLLGLT